MNLLNKKRTHIEDIRKRSIAKIIILLALFLVASAIAIESKTEAQIPAFASSKMHTTNIASCWDPAKGDCYPRIGVFLWGGPPSEWYAQYQLAIGGSSSEIKQLNPNAMVASTLDINAGVGLEIDEWVVRDSNGNKVTIYGGGSDLYNLTDLCPEVGGKRFSDAAIEIMVDLASGVDVLMTDGLWDCPGTWASSNIDLDRNGRNDWDEHGESWICGHWQAGTEKIISGIRQGIGEKPFLINGGGHQNVRDQFNGFLYEYGGPFIYNWYWGWGYYQDLMNTLREPHVIYIDGTSQWGGNMFQAMRFGLGTALLGDAYFSYQMGEWHDHFFIGHFDEYDLNLGYPTSPAYEVKCTPIGWENICVFVRFFDQGAVILNAKGEALQITDQDLRSLAGYSGPYYRFKGGQDPQWNDGSQFVSVTLDGSREPDPNTPGHYQEYWGDVLLLVNQPTTMVAPIIVDENDKVTSPGSNQAELIGGWNVEENVNNVGNFWMMFPYAGGSREAYTTDHAAYAIYRPTIGVPGQYEVFEWHGDKADAQEASNVQYTISHAGGSGVKIVNQQRDHGQWNSLGIYTFNAGTQGHVTISAQGANGTVIADAIKFVYQGNHGNIKGEPASPSEDINQDGRIDSLDLQLAINVLLGLEKDSGTIARADVNRDGQVNRADVLQIGNRILSRK